MKNEIILFEEDEIKLNVNLKDDTVWLNRQQLASLFDRDVKTIKVIDIVNRSHDKFNNDEAKKLFEILGKYTKSLDLLDNYDHKVINENTGSYSNKQITYEED